MKYLKKKNSIWYSDFLIVFQNEPYRNKDKTQIQLKGQMTLNKIILILFAKRNGFSLSFENIEAMLF